jgi:hypothetical protein
VIGNAGRKNLRLVLQPPEGARVNDAVAVALKFVAVGMRELGILAAQRAGHRKP